MRRIDNLTDSEVNWWPYQDIMHELPDICRDDIEIMMWFYTGPCMLFWMVEQYTPERVMHQFDIR
jgi:hypothetical protein